MWAAPPAMAAAAAAAAAAARHHHAALCRLGAAARAFTLPAAAAAPSDQPPVAGPSYSPDSAHEAGSFQSRFAGKHVLTIRAAQPGALEFLTKSDVQNAMECSGLRLRDIV